MTHLRSHPPRRMLPPLESGDRLSRPEFERRYAHSTQVKKAELVEGVVFVASPLRFSAHAEPHSWINTWLGTYAALTPGVRTGIEPTVRLDLDNEFQPDSVLILNESQGGRSHLTADEYLEGTPELVVEIAASSAAIDLGDKKRVYQRNGVPEYLVWQVFENRLDWFALTDGTYMPLRPNDAGIIQSRIFPGLWLAIAPLLQGEMSQVLAALQQGMADVEYAQFVASLPPSRSVDAP